MVRRRLNKKVAFAGSAFFIILALIFIIVIFQFKRDPDEFIKDAQASIQTARQAADQQIKKEHYSIARSKYSSAYGRAKTNEKRKEILYDMADLFTETQDWPYVLDCWNKILVIEPENIKAQYGRLKYFDILGDSGIPNAWQQVNEYASEFLKAAQDAGLLKDNISSLRIPELEQKPSDVKYLGTYLYLIRGRAAFEQANTGAAANVEDMLNTANSDFEQARTFEPNNLNVYMNLARAALAKGKYAESKGNAGDGKKAREQALIFLQQGVTESNSAPMACINLLNLKLMLAQENEPEQIESQFKTLEPEYESLQSKFKSNPDVYEAVSQFYSMYSQFTKLQVSRQYLDKAIDTVIEALKLDVHNVVFALQLTNLSYRRFSIYQNAPDLKKAIETATEALSWPDAQNTPKPGNNARIRNRFLLYSFLANCYIGQIIEPFTEVSQADKTKLLDEAGQVVHEIEMIIGTNEDPLVLKWQGMLELAKGNTQQAVVKLYKAYEQMKAVKPAQPPWPLDLEFAQLSYTLAKIFMGTEETGKAHEFLVNAHYSGITEINPQARLDYVELILDFNRFSDALQNIDAFEADYGPNKRSQHLRVQTYIYSSKLEDAEKELDKMQAEDANTIQLRLALAETHMRQAQMSLVQNEIKSNENQIIPAVTSSQSVTQQKALEDLKTYTKQAADLAEKLLKIKPELVDQSSIINICKACITGNEIEQAKQAIDSYLARYSDNIAINIYKQIFSEPDLGNIPTQRYAEIEQKVLSGLSDPIKRAANLGVFYRRNGDNPKAIEQLNTVLEAVKSMDSAKQKEELDNIRLAAGHLFEIAISAGSWDTAEKVLSIIREKDIDGFKGLFFDARLTAAKKDYKGALTKVDECLRQRPIFSQLYILKSTIDSALENERAYMEDISTAANMNPLDEAIVKQYAIALYNYNQKLGSQAAAAQVKETQDALEKAIALNKGDLELLGIYTDFIAPTDPKRAIAIRQDMLAAVPSVNNAMMLGSLAMNVAANTTKPEDKEGFLDIAGSAFDQARKIDPNDRQVLLYYARYLQQRGKNDEAQKLLESSQDLLLLANHLFQQGDFAGARTALEKLYNDDKRDPNVLRGLMLVTQMTGDRDAVKKYSEELISADNSLNNLVSQVRAFITVGLITEAQYKLQSLKEKYPDEPGLTLLQAWLLLKQNDAKKALETINIYLQGNKNNPAAWQLRGEINSSLTEYERAISDLKTSMSLVNDSSVGILLAKVYIQISRYEDAIAELKNIISKPGYPEEAPLLLENVYIQLGRKTALGNFYDEILQKNPENFQWLNKAGDFAIGTDEFDRAEKYYKKSYEVLRRLLSGEKAGNETYKTFFISALDGYFEALLGGSGISGTASWHPEKAETVLKEGEKSLDLGYAPLIYIRMAQAKITLQDDSKAVEYFHLALNKINANDTNASDALIRLHMFLGLDEIKKFCTQMLEKSPDSIPVNYTMYYLTRTNNEYDKSIEYIDKCIKLTGKESPIRTDYIMKKDETLLFAYGYTSDNKYIAMAFSDYESLLSEMPNNIKVMNNLAYVLAESSQRLSDALEYSGKVLKMRPNDPGYLDTYAFVLFKSGKVSEAEKAIEEALSRYAEQGQTTPGEVYEHKGMIKEKLEKKEEALSAYKRAQELGSSYFSQKIKDRLIKAIERVSP